MTPYTRCLIEDDIKIGVKSTAILFGRYDRLLIGLFQVFFAATLLVIADSFQLGLFLILLHLV